MLKSMSFCSFSGEYGTLNISLAPESAKRKQEAGYGHTLAGQPPRRLEDRASNFYIAGREVVGNKSRYSLTGNILSFSRSGVGSEGLNRRLVVPFENVVSGIWHAAGLKATHAKQRKLGHQNDLFRGSTSSTSTFHGFS